MSSLNTDFLKLNTWEGTDHPLRTEFNANFDTIDSAIADLSKSLNGWKLYNSISGAAPSGLGLPSGASLEEIVTEMQIQSILYTGISSGVTTWTWLPRKHGTLIITKPTSARVSLQYIGFDDSSWLGKKDYYYGIISTDTLIWSGWEQAASQSKLDDLADQLNGWKLYGAVGDLGINYGEEDAQKISDALPAKSILIYTRSGGQGNNSFYPTTTGGTIISIKTTRLDTVTFDYRTYSSSNSNRYAGFYSADTGNWSGWRQMATQDRVDALSEQLGGWRMFSNLAELGIPLGEETAEAIATALPAKSILIYSRSSKGGNADHYPTSAGGNSVIIKSTRTDTVNFQYLSYSTNTSSNGNYYGHYYTANGSWTGWNLSGSLSGTFTPELIDSNGKSPGSYNTANTYGLWRRCGNQITIDVRVSTSDIAPMLEAAATALYVKIPTAIGSDLAVNYGPFPTRAVGFLLPDNYAGSTYAINTRSDLFRLDYMRKSTAEPHRLAAGYITPKMLFEEFTVSFQASYNMSDNANVKLSTNAPVMSSKMSISDAVEDNEASDLLVNPNTGEVTLMIGNHLESLSPGQFDKARNLLTEEQYQKVDELWTDEVIDRYYESLKGGTDEN